MTDGVERNENGLSLFTPFSVYFWRTTSYLGCFRREQTAPANQISGLGWRRIRADGLILLRDERQHPTARSVSRTKLVEVNWASYAKPPVWYCTLEE
jgi:hypothetical protein